MSYPHHDPIKITSIELRRVKLRLQKPFKTSFGTQQERDTIIVMLHTDDGLVGIGETPSLVAPIFDHQYVWADLDVLKRYLVPMIFEQLNGEIRSYEDLLRVFNQIKAHHFAKCGIDAAYWNLVALKEQKSLQSLLDGTMERVLTGFSIGGASVYDVLERATAAVDAGFRRLKLKIWPGFDRMVVDAVRQRFPQTMLQVDANASYDPFNTEHINTLKSLDDFDLLLIEQPFAANRVLDHVKFQREHNIRTPFCLDESLQTLDDARQAVELWSMFNIKDRLIINIKSARVGGFWPAKQIADYAQENEVICWVGGMLETGIGKWMNIILSSHPACTLPGDHLQPQPYYEQDIVTPLPEVGARGMITVPREGLGWELDMDTLEALTIDRVLYP